MKNARSIYWGIIVIGLIIVSGGIYYLLDGFDPVKVYFFNGATRTVIGKEYYIPNDHKIFRTKMDSATIDLENETLKGKLTTVVYQDQWINKDSIHCFIGASQDSIKEALRIPPGYDCKKFSTNRIYRIFITQNQWTQPTPETIEEIMAIKSMEEGDVFQPLTFELYHRDKSLHVEKWVK
ncbi:MAG: hypothetical protein AAGC64_04240 [Bacteroidota bacterium]